MHDGKPKKYVIIGSWKIYIPLKLPIIWWTGSPEEIMRFSDAITGRPAPTCKNIITSSIIVHQSIENSIFQFK